MSSDLIITPADFSREDLKTDREEWKLEQLAGFPDELLEKIVGLYIPAEVIQAQIQKLADYLNQEYAEKNPVLVGLPNGAIPFFVDLSQKLHIPHEWDCSMKIESYVDDESTGKPVLITPPSHRIRGRHILLLDDIVDSFNTMHFAQKVVGIYDPRTVKTVGLFDKFEARSARFIGKDADIQLIKIRNIYLIGYGLDSNEQFRHLKDVYAMG